MADFPGDDGPFRTRDLGTDSGDSSPGAVVLVARVAGREVARYLLSAGTGRVGSGATNELVIEDDTVSRSHVQVVLRREGIEVTDLDSTNGTKYQGARIKSMMAPVGAAFRLGKAELRIEVPGSGPRAQFGVIESSAEPMIRAIEMLALAAKAPATVLLEGETGCGKELAARALHEGSPRKAKPFEIVDCGALAANLAASELFGHVRGAFTGAERDREGAFERADGGTLFLDEVGELPLEMQPLLLRALESREVRRVGGKDYRPVDVRVVAATNRDLDEDAAGSRFRMDLLHRLAVVRVRIPSLRERLDDLPHLVRNILDRLGPAAEGVTLSPETIRALRAYPWPGNVRELRNFLERVVTLRAAGATDPEHELLPEPSPGAAGSGDPSALEYREARSQALDAFEKDYVQHVLARSAGNVSQAAREAGIDRVYLHRLMKKHGIKAD